MMKAKSDLLSVIWGASKACDVIQLKSESLRTKNPNVQGQQKMNVPAPTESKFGVLFCSSPQGTKWFPSPCIGEDHLLFSPNDSNVNFIQKHPCGSTINNVLSDIWVSLCLVKMTHKISHYNCLCLGILLKLFYFLMVPVKLYLSPPFPQPIAYVYFTGFVISCFVVRLLCIYLIFSTGF